MDNTLFANLYWLNCLFQITGKLLFTFLLSVHVNLWTVIRLRFMASLFQMVLERAVTTNTKRCICHHFLIVFFIPMFSYPFCIFHVDTVCWLHKDEADICFHKSYAFRKISITSICTKNDSEREKNLWKDSMKIIVNNGWFPWK